jgi:hypothetical protein
MKVFEHSCLVGRSWLLCLLVFERSVMFNGHPFFQRQHELTSDALKEDDGKVYCNKNSWSLKASKP